MPAHNHIRQKNIDLFELAIDVLKSISASGDNAVFALAAPFEPYFAFYACEHINRRLNDVYGFALALNGLLALPARLL